MQALTTIDYADEYFESKPNVEKWDEVAYTSGEKWIAEASRRIYAITGINIPQFDVVPDDLQQACCEVIYGLLNFGDETNPHNINKKLGISSISFGNDSASYKDDTTSDSGVDNAVFSDYAQSILSKYIRKAYPYV